MIIMQLVVVYPAGSGAEPLRPMQGRGGEGRALESTE